MAGSTAVTPSLAEQVYDAYAAVTQGGDPDKCRATLGALRTEHGDMAFEAAKIRALIALNRAQGLA